MDDDVRPLEPRVVEALCFLILFTENKTRIKEPECEESYSFFSFPLMLTTNNARFVFHLGLLIFTLLQFSNRTRIVRRRKILRNNYQFSENDNQLDNNHNLTATMGT